MTRPDAGETPQRASLVASIERTLAAEARHNELVMAGVRAAVLSLVCVSEVAFHLSGGGVDFVYRLPTFLFAGMAWCLFGLLWRGYHHRAFGVFVPGLDGLFLLIRMQTTFSSHPIGVLEEGMELATVLGAACLLVASGAFRLSRGSLLTSSATGFLAYGWFAAQTRISAGQLLVHGALLGGIAGLTWMLTRQVRRAVRGEVSRVTLARFLPASVLDDALHDPIALVTSARAVRATVVVSDIRGFTRWAEDKPPIEVLDALNVVQGALAEVVAKHGGVVDKFMGDGLLAVFGAVEPQPDHADRAVRSAVEMRAVVAALATRHLTPFRVGVGVHSGELVVGCLGSGLRLEFTVLGDTVNTASRLEAATKDHDVDIAISGDTATEATGTPLRSLGEITLRGRDRPIALFTPAEQAPSP